MRNIIWCLIPVSAASFVTSLNDGLDALPANDNTMEAERALFDGFTVPFKAQASEYTDFFTSDGKKVGDCGSGIEDGESAEHHECDGCFVGPTRPGNWLEYGFESENDAVVKISFRLASSTTDQRFRAMIDGKSISSNKKSPGKGTRKYEDQLVSEEVFVSRGSHTLRVKFIHGGIKLCSLDVSLVGTFIPGLTNETRIQAQNYQRFFEKTLDVNSGGACDRGDGVDMTTTSDPTGGVCSVMGKKREWLEYDILVRTKQTYSFIARVSSANPDNHFHIEVNGDDVSGFINGPGLGRQNFQDAVTIPGIVLIPGRHKLRVAFDTGGVNINYIRIFGESRKPFDVAVYMPRKIKTCFVGERCRPKTGEECTGLYNDTGHLVKNFKKTAFEAVATTSPERQESDFVTCLKMSTSDEKYEKVKAEVLHFESFVNEHASGKLELQVHIIDIDVLDIGQTRRFNNVWVSSNNMREYLSGRLDFRPDFNIIMAPIRDAKKKLSQGIAACGLALGAPAGVAGGGWSWVPITGDSTWFECAQQGTITHEWLHQVHFAYHKLSGFTDLYGWSLPPCGEGTWDQYKWFPDTHQCTSDPDFESCGEDTCSGNGEINSHILRDHFDPKVLFVANHCKNGIRDETETSIDNGGLCGDSEGTFSLSEPEEQPPPQYISPLP